MNGFFLPGANVKVVPLSPWGLAVVPLVILVRVDVECVLLRCAVLLPLPLTVALDGAVAAIVRAVLQVAGHSNLRRHSHDCGSDHGVTLVDCGLPSVFLARLDNILNLIH